ncbi:MAG: 30S ribosomal protein S1 [Nitrospirota bacterium]
MLKLKRAAWGRVEEELSGQAESKKQEMDLLYEETFKTFEEGAILQGTVVGIGADGVMVDVGYKSEALIANDEFTKEALSAVQIGETMPFFLEGLEDEDGNILLSKEKADKISVWEEIEETYKKDGIVEGKVLSQIKGGLVVDIGVKAFLPGSQIDFKPIRDLDSLVGKTYPLKIVKMSPKRGNIVVSRRALLERTRDQKRSTALSSLKEGQTVDGIVKNITDYGAFLDLGGIDGLLHITDIAWGRIGHPSDRIKVGDKMPVVILKYDKETSRVSLGLKQLTPDPWTTVEVRYPIGSKAAGRVMSLADYGVFIEVEPGVEGLVHVSEISWARDIKHPSKLVSVGDTVTFLILNIDKKGRKLSLGMKQAESNPWDHIEQRYIVGEKVLGKIKSITDFGVFVGLEETIDGLVHISDISWTRHLKHPSEVFKKGQEIDAVILKVDREKERISLGFKQTTPDPWQDVAKKYPIGTSITGVVSKYVDFGFFVDLQEGVVGLVHLSETGVSSPEEAISLYPVGAEVSVRILRIELADRKIALSMKDVG